MGTSGDWQLRDEYIAALNRRIEADSELRTFLARTTNITQQQGLELERLLKSDKRAEEELAVAKTAYLRSI